MILYSCKGDKNAGKNHRKDRKKIEEVIDFVWKSGGIEYAKQAMYRYRDEAIALLRQFPDSVARHTGIGILAMGILHYSRTL